MTLNGLNNNKTNNVCNDIPARVCSSTKIRNVRRSVPVIDNRQMTVTFGLDPNANDPIKVLS